MKACSVSLQSDFSNYWLGIHNTYIIQSVLLFSQIRVNRDHFDNVICMRNFSKMLKSFVHHCHALDF